MGQESRVGRIAKSAFRCIFILNTIITCVHGLVTAAGNSPLAQTLNGTYYGVHSLKYHQNWFLGVPFAQPPIGDLRLRAPASLNQTWPGLRNATEYGYACVGYGEDTTVGANNYVSEDCLTLNVIVPAGYEGVKLPVGVWIYGGSFVNGAALDPRYNLTFIVEQSVQIGKPFIGVSLNYRLSGWGFLWSKEIVKAGVANLGLRDQRLALHWLQENVAGFGGDPKQVTIWGESAGAGSVSTHMLAYNGRNDGLFQGAICESGPLAGVGLTNPTKFAAEEAYNNATVAAGCNNAEDGVDCLRRLSFKKLNHVFKTAVGTEDLYSVYFGPLEDGDLIVRGSIKQVIDGDFVKVPYIMGDNSDEGTLFVPLGMNAEQEFLDFFGGYNLSEKTLHNLAKLYPANSKENIPQSHPRNFNKTIGTQFKRAATLAGDITFKAPRRLSANYWLKHTKHTKSAPLFSYRFNAIPNGLPDYLAVTHFQEIPFVFHNVHGYGYPNKNPPFFGPNPFGSKPPSYKELSKRMSRMWASFIHDGNPNYKKQPVPHWYAYTHNEKTNLVFDADVPTYIEQDTYRQAGIDYLIGKYVEGNYPWGKHDHS